MSIRTILACLVDEATAGPLTRSGATMGRRFGAHLTGLHVVEAMPVYPDMGVYVPAPIVEPYNAGQLDRARAIEAAFRKEAAGDDLESEWRQVKAGWTTTGAVLIESARAADLVLMAQASQGPGWNTVRALQDDVIRAGGRPVLVLPGARSPRPSAGACSWAEAPRARRRARSTTRFRCWRRVRRRPCSASAARGRTRWPTPARTTSPRRCRATARG